MLDEVADFGGVEGHELVHFVHAVDAVVGLDGVAEDAAAEQGAEEFVEVGEEEAGTCVSWDEMGCG